MIHLNAVLVGHDLLVDGLVSWLKQQPEVDIMATVPSLEDVLPVLERLPANVLIAFGSFELTLECLCSIRFRYPGLPIVHCSVAEDIIRVLPSWAFAADPQGLISALETLSRAGDHFGFNYSSGGLS